MSRWLRPLVVCLLLIAFGLIVSRQTFDMLQSCARFCIDQHAQIIAGTALTPFRYRVLGALIVEGLNIPTLAGYGLAHAVAMPLMLVMLYVWLRRHAAPALALSGVLMLAAYMPIMLRVYAISLYNPLELILLCAALLYRRDGLLMLALVIVAAFNRETSPALMIGGLAALNYPALRQGNRRALVWLFVYGLAAVAIFASLRMALGIGRDMVTVAGAWNTNTTSVWHMGEATFNHAVLVPIWILAFYGWRGASGALKRLALVSLPYLATLAVFALWNETRLLMPLFVLVMPLVLRGFDRLVNLSPIGDKARARVDAG